MMSAVARKFTQGHALLHAYFSAFLKKKNLKKIFKFQKFQSVY